MLKKATDEKEKRSYPRGSWAVDSQAVSHRDWRASLAQSPVCCYLRLVIVTKDSFSTALFQFFRKRRQSISHYYATGLEPVFPVQLVEGWGGVLTSIRYVRSNAYLRHSFFAVLGRFELPSLAFQQASYPLRRQNSVKIGVIFEQC